jgi:hypothetical protein
MMTYKKIGGYSLLIIGLLLVFASCKKKSDSDNAAPNYLDYSRSPWIAYQSSQEDTIQIENNELIMAFGTRNFSDTRSLSSLSRLLPISGDFEMVLDYEKASNFFLTVIANDQTDKNAMISVSNITSGISFESSYAMIKSDSVDFEASTSGTMTVNRTGQLLKVTIVKNYISNSIPAQKIHEYSCPNFHTGANTLTFSALPFTGATIGVTMKRFALTTTEKSIVDNFSSSDSLYVSRNY